MLDSGPDCPECDRCGEEAVFSYDDEWLCSSCLEDVAEEEYEEDEDLE